jgi:hypothetical protein
MNRVRHPFIDFFHHKAGRFEEALFRRQIALRRALQKPATAFDRESRRPIERKEPGLGKLDRMDNMARFL